jgi:hypothetical protein
MRLNHVSNMNEKISRSSFLVVCNFEVKTKANGISYSSVLMGHKKLAISIQVSKLVCFISTHIGVTSYKQTAYYWFGLVPVGKILRNIAYNLYIGTIIFQISFLTIILPRRSRPRLSDNHFTHPSFYSA